MCRREANIAAIRIAPPYAASTREPMNLSLLAMAGGCLTTRETLGSQGNDQGDAIAMTDAELDAFMDASAVVLGLTVEPEWRATVRANLAVTFRMGALVADFELSDEAEPAPVFTA
jgi:Protein of unknown function (DUF4089)